MSKTMCREAIIPFVIKQPENIIDHYNPSERIAKSCLCFIHYLTYDKVHKFNVYLHHATFIVKYVTYKSLPHEISSNS